MNSDWLQKAIRHPRHSKKKKIYGIFRLKNIKHIDIHKKDTAQTQGNMLK